MQFEKPIKVKSPVKLERNRLTTSGDFLNFLLEASIFLKLQCFKNNPRANFFLLRALYIVPAFSIAAALIFFGLIYLLFHLTHWAPLHPVDGTSLKYFFLHAIRNPDGLVETKSVFCGYMAASSLAYWNLTTVFRQQWAHANDTYRKMLENLDSAERMSCNLALDLIVLDLWAHRSFRDLFAAELEAAVECQYGAASPLVIEKINAGKFTECEVLAVLENYQCHQKSEIADATDDASESPLSGNRTKINQPRPRKRYIHRSAKNSSKNQRNTRA